MIRRLCWCPDLAERRKFERQCKEDSPRRGLGEAVAFYWQKRVPLDSSPKLKILVVVAAHKQRQSLASQLGVLYKEIIFLILISVWIGCWDGDGGHKGKLKTDGNRIVC
jgi:hypothetical protein